MPREPLLRPGDQVEVRMRPCKIAARNVCPLTSMKWSDIDFDRHIGPFLGTGQEWHHQRCALLALAVPLLIASTLLLRVLKLS